ncbi:hypothetical protein AFLA_008708 [Aspergillus flavus NRRL3357]|nr:hypothetical protein AFLA_008708 [Aspergillus flavus NRRL3357]
MSLAVVESFLDSILLLSFLLAHTLAVAASGMILLYGSPGETTEGRRRHPCLCPAGLCNQNPGLFTIRIFNQQVGSTEEDINVTQ